MKTRGLSDAWKATMLVWAAGATLVGALTLELSKEPSMSSPPGGEVAWNPVPTASGLKRPLPPRRVAVTRTRAS